jgi:carbamoyl-phosphate synthase large subunit
MSTVQEQEDRGFGRAQVRIDAARTVLVTGAGGAAAVVLLRSLMGRVRLVAADTDPLAVGLYLVPRERRVLLPRGDDPEFVPQLLAQAIAFRADLVIPTVDSELRAVSAARADFARHGIRLLVESPDTLDACLDKLELTRRCAPMVRVPQTVLLGNDLDAAALEGLGRPFVVKPRAGAGGRGFAVVTGTRQLEGLPHDGTFILQEYLPGTEYSIDVLARADGHIVAAVPRTRDKVDSGIAVAGRTVRDGGLERFGRAVAATVGATTVINVQARCAQDGALALLEVNARFPGTMSLTQAAGIDMPVLAVAAALGQALPDHIDFREIAVVRHWSEVVVPISQYGLVPSGAEPALR